MIVDIISQAINESTGFIDLTKIIEHTVSLPLIKIRSDAVKGNHNGILKSRKHAVFVKGIHAGTRTAIGARKVIDQYVSWILGESQHGDRQQHPNKQCSLFHMA